MFLIDSSLTEQIQKSGKESVDFLSKVVWPALAALVPAAGTAIFKIGQDHSRARRSVQLTERISALSKMIADLPELPTSANSVRVSPRDALITELNLAVSELCSIQSKVHLNFRSFSSNASARLRSAFLLYRPKGFRAVVLHGMFYVYSTGAALCLMLFLIGAGTSDTTETSALTDSSHSSFYSALLGFVLLVAIFSIPAMVIRHFAARIHRRQTAEPQANAIPDALNPIAVPVAITRSQA